MQPLEDRLPAPSAPSIETMKWGANEVADYYLYIRMSCDHDSVASFGKNLLGSVGEMVFAYQDGSRYAELAFLQPAWDYLGNLVKKIQKASEEDIKIVKDGCIIDIVDERDPELFNWKRTRKELQALLTKVEENIYMQKNPNWSRDDAAVAVALNPILVLK